MENINTSEYWDSVYKQEGRTTWRNYPQTWSMMELNIPKGSRVLEIGSGDGQFAETIKDRVSDYVGIDHSEIACSYAVQRTGMTFFAISSDEYIKRTLPMAQGKKKLFDVVVMSQTLEHFDDPESLFKSLIILSDKIIIAVPDAGVCKDDCKEHTQFFTMDSLRELMQKFYKDVKINRLTDSVPCNMGMLHPISLVAVGIN